VFENEADALITAIGALNVALATNYLDFTTSIGKSLHSAAWDQDYDYTVRFTEGISRKRLTCLQGKQITVIGAGSSGIQVILSLQPEVKHLDHYLRRRIWIAGTFAREELDIRVGNASSFEYTQGEKFSWQRDPVFYLAVRKKVEAELQGGYLVTVRGSEAQQQARKEFTQSMHDRLVEKPELADNLLLDFSPLCKGTTPGLGHLEALTANHVSIIPKSISKITSTGITDLDGTHQPVDVILCATGSDTGFQKRMPI